MSEVLDEPAPPTMPSVERPDSIRRSMLDMFFGARRILCSDTPSETTEPSATSAAPLAGGGAWSCLRPRSRIRRLSVVMTKMKASISMCVRIWMPGDEGGQAALRQPRYRQSSHDDRSLTVDGHDRGEDEEHHDGKVERNRAFGVRVLRTPVRRRNPVVSYPR